MVRFDFKKIREVELSLGLLSLFWGFNLVLPINSFDNSTAYRAMDEIASELFWGIIMTIVGLFHLISLIRNDKRLRKMSLLMSAGQWYFIATMIFLGSYVSIEWGTYFIIACLSTWIYVRVGD